jgi:hypothetical protein
VAEDAFIEPYLGAFFAFNFNYFNCGGRAISDADSAVGAYN